MDGWGPLAGDAGIGDDYIGDAMSCGEVRRGRAQRGFIADVARIYLGCHGTQRRRERGKRIRAPREEPQLRAFPGILPRKRGADAGGRTGQEDFHARRAAPSSLARPESDQDFVRSARALAINASSTAGTAACSTRPVTNLPSTTMVGTDWML